MKITRREAIQRSLLAALAIATPAVAKATIFILILVVLTISLYILWSLWSLCRRVFPNPPPPDQADNSSYRLKNLDAAPVSPGVKQIRIPLTLREENVYRINPTSPDFNDPDGNLYSGFVSLKISSSLTLATWNPCGKVTLWFNESWLRVVQLAENGATVLDRTINNWKDETLELAYADGGAGAFFRCENNN